MLYVLQYPNFTTFDYAISMVDRDGAISQNKLYNWLLFGKLPESVNITPEYAEVYQVPGRRGYISSVTVEPIPPGVGTVALAAGATMTITNPKIESAESSNVAYATATVSNGTLTITGVAAGTAVITVKDKANDLVYTITATVT